MGEGEENQSQEMNQEQPKQNNLFDELARPGAEGDPELDLGRLDLEEDLEEEKVDWFVWKECEEESRLGRLKKTTSMKCPECGALLEIRVFQESAIEDGEDVLKDAEYYMCKNRCGYEKEIEPKRRRGKKLEFADREEDDYGKKRKQRDSNNQRRSIDKNPPRYKRKSY